MPPDGYPALQYLQSVRVRNAQVILAYFLDSFMNRSDLLASAVMCPASPRARHLATRGPRVPEASHELNPGKSKRGPGARVSTQAEQPALPIDSSFQDFLY